MPLGCTGAASNKIGSHVGLRADHAPRLAGCVGGRANPTYDTGQLPRGAGGWHRSRQAGRRVRDRGAHGARDAGVAPVVHVEFVLRQEFIEGQLLLLAPVPHQLEAAEQIDVGALGGLRDQIDNELRPLMAAAQHLGRVLRIDQHDVGTGRPAQMLDAALQDRQMRLHRIAAKHGVGAELPEHEVRLLGDDVALEAGALVMVGVAVDAAVDHDEAMAGEAIRQLDPQPAGIRALWRACPLAEGRRGADSHDLDRSLRRQPLCGPPQRILELGEFGRDRTWQRQHRPDDGARGRCGCGLLPAGGSDCGQCHGGEDEDRVAQGDNELHGRCNAFGLQTTHSRCEQVAVRATQFQASNHGILKIRTATPGQDGVSQDRSMPGH